MSPYEQYIALRREVAALDIAEMSATEFDRYCEKLEVLWKKLSLSEQTLLSKDTL